MDDNRITPDQGAAEICTAEGCAIDPVAAPRSATPAVATDAPPLPASPADSAGRLDVVSDAICPWCWIGKRQLDTALAMLAETDGLRFEIHWRAFQLNPDMPAEGVERASYRAAKFGGAERARAADERVAEAGRAVGLEFRHDRMLRTPNTLQAHRLIRLAGPTGRQHAVVEALFAAYFHAGRDIGDPAELERIGAEAGLDEATLSAFRGGQAALHEVLEEDFGLRGAGLSGVPSFVLDRHLLFSGAVPAEHMAEALRQAHRILAGRRRSSAAEAGDAVA